MQRPQYEHVDTAGEMHRGALSKLSVKELKERVFAAGGSIPKGHLEKADLISILHHFEESEDRKQSRSQSRPSRAGGTDEAAEELVQVPPALMPRIIGRQGATITKIEKESGAYINVNKDDKGSLRISGSSRAMLRAKELISELVVDLCKDFLFLAKLIGVDEWPISVDERSIAVD